jgi:hypothetical protein
VQSQDGIAVPIGMDPDAFHWVADCGISH